MWTKVFEKTVPRSEAERFLDSNEYDLADREDVDLVPEVLFDPIADTITFRVWQREKDV